MLPRRVAHLLIALVVIGALWGGTGRAGAAPNERANCTGEFASGNAGPGYGEFASGVAREAGGLGHFVGPNAANDTCDYAVP